MVSLHLLKGPFGTHVGLKGGVLERHCAITRACCRQRFTRALGGPDEGLLNENRNFQMPISWARWRRQRYCRWAAEQCGNYNSCESPKKVISLNWWRGLPIGVRPVIWAAGAWETVSQRDSNNARLSEWGWSQGRTLIPYRWDTWFSSKSSIGKHQVLLMGKTRDLVNYSGNCQT